MNALVWPLLLFDPALDKRRETRVRSNVADVPRHEPRLLCAKCKYVVTYPIHRISVDGAHEHNCINPEGTIYRIGCYCEANGCAPVEPGTPTFTWFAGYAWRAALCKNCGTHLGWRFDATADHFYGLILDHLTTEQQHDGHSTGG